MNSADSAAQTDLTDRLALLRATDEGRLDGLKCPHCQSATVSVSFTHPGEQEYRTWFSCSVCAFEMRAQNTERPVHYSLERDRSAGVAAINQRS